MSSKKKKIGWAIVGLGLQAEKMAKAIQAGESSVLVAVVSKDEKRARTFAHAYGVRVSHVSYASMLEERDIDAVLVASPNHEHAHDTIQALKAGKHVLCEKPMTLSYSEGVAMIRAARENKVKLGVGFHLRFHPLVHEVRKVIAQGRIGELVMIEMNWSVGRVGQMKLPPLPLFMRWREKIAQSGGGAIMARGVHLFDLLCFITGLPAEEVSAFSDSRKRSGSDTLITGIVRFGKTFATLTTSRRIPNSLNDIIVYGSHGRCILKNALTEDGSGTLEVLSNGKRALKKYPRRNLYKKEIEGFGERIRGRHSEGATGPDGLKVIAITEAFLGSARMKKVVRIKK